MKFSILAAIILIFFKLNSISGQKIEWLDSSQSASSFRGLSICPDGTIWVSGSKGAIGKSTDKGKTWDWVNPIGFENRDFRDVESFDSQTALAMAVDSPGIILRTTDGGKSWKSVYVNNQKGIFLDDMSFRNPKEGICVGDPLSDGRLVILTTSNGGETWTTLKNEQRPLVEQGEAMFAASGSNAAPDPGNKHAYLLATGGKVSRVWTIFPFQPSKNPMVITLPIQQGNQMTGANGISIIGKYVMFPGGNYLDPNRSDSNFAIMYKNHPPQLIEIAGGYKSSIADIGNGLRVAVGITGISMHEGPFPSYPNPWKVISTEPFHVVKVLPGTGEFVLVGSRGRIARLIF
jgi:hypothetical protein